MDKIRTLDILKEKLIKIKKGENKMKDIRKNITLLIAIIVLSLQGTPLLRANEDEENNYETCAKEGKVWNDIAAECVKSSGFF
ncbi:MAG: hypothetical protein JSS34_06465 [Proteobacteria bacterium]|nr:hypothetical protein [Pseudomonadota bacterium]